MLFRSLGTVTSLARQAGVQPSAIVRFAQSFGFSGFSELQGMFKAHLQAGWTGISSAAVPGEAAAMVEGFVQASQTSLARVLQRLDMRQFEAMAAVLAGADIIYVAGAKRAFSAASHVALALSKLGIRNMLIDNVGSAAFEHARCALPRDALLAISFAPYNSITPELAASAAQRGVPVVSITDAAASPLAPLSKAHVEIEEDGHAGFRSLAATLAVAMALVLQVARLRGDTSTGET